MSISIAAELPQTVETGWHEYRQRQSPLVLFLSAILMIVPALHGDCLETMSSPWIAGQELSERNRKSSITTDFIVGAFPGPPDGQINAARFREIAEAGIDVIVPFWGTMNGAHNRDMLDLAQAAGLRVLAMDTRIGPLTQSPSAEFDPSVIESIVGDYRAHPALFAYGVRDEPSAELFPRIAEICREFRRLDRDHPPLVNLFPGYATPEQLATESYREYVLKYIKAVDPVVLMYDHYPYKVNRAIDTGWHRDLALFREVSRRSDIGFWVFVQCQGIRGSLRVPTQAEIFRQAATALAYGARGIWWYRYWTQPPDEKSVQDRDGTGPLERHPGSMIDRHGNRSPSYNYVRDTNRFLRLAGPALLGWDNTNVARVLTEQYTTEDSCPSISLTGEHLDLVVGTFAQGTTIRLVLANDDCERPAIFRVAAGDDLQIKHVIASWNAEVPSDLNIEADTWSLGPAGCVVMELSP